ncbi:pterin-4-alpha-carbinolamine dehydratase [Thiocapsa imhoffii]|uniref:4a-hydroxytetrahydrobiopterin dehydratase n=1 Tax=Thiocapsa imhoffii TaxID=382777 RepID=A0A9X0WH57_9GAMM|nr:4a-hydroxytetrahydrobiopterin dehydratase [Thiocapsa imhoffii]MBK1644622.1 pterin-4-alpha-carbinolamine dehydratase [Thiocapsa imhoffii]
MKQEWSERQRPPRLERRLEFPDYEATRAFLERAAELSEQSGVYPDLSFGRTYVNVTLHAPDGATEVDDTLHRFARDLDVLVAPADDVSAAPASRDGSASA